MSSKRRCEDRTSSKGRELCRDRRTAEVRMTAAKWIFPAGKSVGACCTIVEPRSIHVCTCKNQLTDSSLALDGAARPVGSSDGMPFGARIAGRWGQNRMAMQRSLDRHVQVVKMHQLVLVLVGGGRPCCRLVEPKSAVIDGHTGASGRTLGVSG